jgi:hypothetical protein
MTQIDEKALEAVKDALGQIHNPWLEKGMRAIITAYLAALPPAPADVAGLVMKARHRKRGTTYTIEGSAHLQTDTPLSDMAELIVYRSDHDGSLWVRPTTEFNDGRFDLLEEPRAFPPTGYVGELVKEARIAELERELSAERAKFKPDWANFHEGVSVGEASATARIAELERELKARKNYTDEDYIRLHNAHCFTAIKLATATAHAETLEAALREAQEAWSRYEKFLDLTGTATDIERAYNDLCAALQPPEAP